MRAEQAYEAAQHNPTDQEQVDEAKVDASLDAADGVYWRKCSSWARTIKDKNKNNSNNLVEAARMPGAWGARWSSNRPIPQVR